MSITPLNNTLNLKTRDQFVTDEIAAIQAALPGQFAFPIGSIVRALVDAHGSTAIWEESLIQFVLQRTRLSTSEGHDADTFVEDFGLERLPAVAATGNVTFSRYTATQQALISIGATVTTQAGDVSFAVYVDPLNPGPNYNPDLNAYVIAAGVSSLSVPVKATTAGTIGNVIANVITVINSPITGVDTVTNPLAFSTGKEAQSDSELRKYFVDYINSLSRATKSAIEFAIESVQEGLEYIVVENTNYSNGTQQLGYFYAVVDDGSGNPPASLISSVKNAVEAYRGLTIRYDVFAPVIVSANIVATVDLPSGYTNDNLVDLISTGLETYINLIPFGGTLFYTRIFQIIYNVLKDNVPASLLDEFNVTGITLNGSTSDLVSNTTQAIRPGTITINLA